MKALCDYRNGNYNVRILSDGTKIRYGDVEVFDASFPESIDLNITDWCNVGCGFCYRGCTENGSVFKFDKSKLDSLGFKAGMEIALGGGSPIRHPEIDDFCEYFNGIGCIPNITVHWSSMMHVIGGDLEHLQMLQQAGLLHGIGVSVRDYDPGTARTMKCFIKNAVAHVIAGIVEPDDLYRFYQNGIPILILGYKNMGRGLIGSDSERTEIEDRISRLKSMVHSIIRGEPLESHESKYGPVHDDANGRSIMSFDNLALRQLDIRGAVDEERWNEMYMGDDGIDGEMSSASMYMDLVGWTYARNSVDAESFKIGSGDTIEKMYCRLKGLKGFARKV